MTLVQRAWASAPRSPTLFQYSWKFRGKRGQSPRGQFYTIAIITAIRQVRRFGKVRAPCPTSKSSFYISIWTTRFRSNSESEVFMLRLICSKREITTSKFQFLNNYRERSNIKARLWLLVSPLTDWVPHKPAKWLRWNRTHMASDTSVSSIWNNHYGVLDGSSWRNGPNGYG